MSGINLVYGATSKALGSASTGGYALELAKHKHDHADIKGTEKEKSTSYADYIKSNDKEPTATNAMKGDRAAISAKDNEKLEDSQARGILAFQTADPEELARAMLAGSADDPVLLAAVIAAIKKAQRNPDLISPSLVHAALVGTPENLKEMGAKYGLPYGADGAYDADSKTALISKVAISKGGTHLDLAVGEEAIGEPLADFITAELKKNHKVKGAGIDLADVFTGDAGARASMILNGSTVDDAIKYVGHSGGPDKITALVNGKLVEADAKFGFWAWVAEGAMIVGGAAAGFAVGGPIGALAGAAAGAATGGIVLTSLQLEDLQDDGKINDSHKKKKGDKNKKDDEADDDSGKPVIAVDSKDVTVPMPSDGFDQKKLKALKKELDNSIGERIDSATQKNIESGARALLQSIDPKANTTDMNFNKVLKKIYELGGNGFYPVLLGQIGVNTPILKDFLDATIFDKTKFRGVFDSGLTQFTPNKEGGYDFKLSMHLHSEVNNSLKIKDLLKNVHPSIAALAEEMDLGFIFQLMRNVGLRLTYSSDENGKVKLKGYNWVDDPIIRAGLNGKYLKPLTSKAADRINKAMSSAEQPTPETLQELGLPESSATGDSENVVSVRFKVKEGDRPIEILIDALEGAASAEGQTAIANTDVTAGAVEGQLAKILKKGVKYLEKFADYPTQSIGMSYHFPKEYDDVSKLLKDIALNTGIAVPTANAFGFLMKHYHALGLNQLGNRGTAIASSLVGLLIGGVVAGAQHAMEDPEKVGALLSFGPNDFQYSGSNNITWASVWPRFVRPLV